MKKSINFNSTIYTMQSYTNRSFVFVIYHTSILPQEQPIVVSMPWILSSRIPSLSSRCIPGQWFPLLYMRFLRQGPPATFDPLRPGRQKANHRCLRKVPQRGFYNCCCVHPMVMAIPGQLTVSDTHGVVDCNTDKDLGALNDRF